jgi:hypothetical protein
MCKSLWIVGALITLLASAACAQDPGKQLRKAVIADDSAAFTALVASKAAVNRSNIDGVTPLMIAASLGKTKFVKGLIAAGATLDARTTKDGLTALIFAADFYHLDAVQTLIEAGASVKATDKQEYSAIDYAIIPNKEEVSVPDTEKKIQADRARADIKYLDSKGAVPKKGGPGTGSDVGGALGNLLAIGGQADLKDLVDRARQER